MILGGDWTLTSLIKLNNKYCTSKCLKMGGPTEECSSHSSPIEHIDTDRPSPQYLHLLVCVSIYAFSGSFKPKLPMLPKSKMPQMPSPRDSVFHQLHTAPVQIRPIRFWKGIFMPSIQPGTSQPQLHNSWR